LDVVVHLAAFPKPWASWETIYKTNLPIDYNVFSACVQANVRRVVYASTNHVQHGMTMGEGGPESINTRVFGAHVGATLKESDAPAPDSFYAAGKLLGEALGRYHAQLHALEVVCLRIGWIVPEENPLNSKWVETELHRQFMRAMWLSLPDCEDIFYRAISRDVSAYQFGKGKFLVAYAVSRNSRRVFDLSFAEQALGYVPRHNAELFFERSKL
jgi:hypothetical protein